MSLESLLLDPVEMNVANAELELVNRASGIDVVTFDAPHPDLNVLYASSMDTEGGISVASARQNRTITLTVRCFDAIPGSGQMLSRIRELQQKVGTFQRQGGVLQRTLSTGQVVRFDITQDARVTVPADQMFTRFGSAICTLTLVCKPLGYGRELSLTFHTETTLPVLRFVEPVIGGDVPALGRLVVNNDSPTSDQAWAQVAWRSRTYDGTATAALFYEAETRLRQGGAILAARSGASGGTVVRQGTLTTSYQSMMSLATSGTVYSQHVGSYDVWARVYDPGGTAGATSGGTVGNVDLALEWAQGDLTQVTRNDPVSPQAINGYSIVDLGQVHLELAVSGAQRWDGRVIAKGTQTNQSVDVDCVWLAPVGEGSMTVEAVSVVAAPTVITARDEFAGTTAGGTLTTRTPPIGAAWAESGDTGSFTFSDNGFSSGSEEVQRTATSDSGGRFAVFGSSVINTEVGVTVNTSNPLAQTGLGAVARFTNSSNFFGVSLSASTSELNVFRSVGSAVNIATGRIGGLYPVGTNFVYKLRLVTLANGFWWAGWFQSDDTLIVSVSGFDAQLTVTGALASGKGGIWDINGVGAATRHYDNVYVATPPPPDAAVYAGQSLELRSDRVRREDSTGSVWGPVGKAEGQYLLVPPSGQEGRSTEFLVKLSRGGPTPAGDPAMDDLSAQLFVTPRYLNIGES